MAGFGHTAEGDEAAEPTDRDVGTEHPTTDLVRIYDRLRFLSLAAGGFGLIVGVVVIVGWITGNETLKSVAPGFATMKVNTAISIGLLGLGLIVVASRPTAAKAGALLATIPLLLASITLAEYATGLDLAIDNRIIQDTASASLPGRMSLATAFAIASEALALVVLVWPRSRPHASQRFAQIALLIVAVALVGYLYGVEDLYRFGPYASMAVHTATALAVLSLGVVVLRPDKALVARLFAPGPGGIMIRTLLVSTSTIPLAVGFVALVGARAGLYSPEFAVALVVIVLTVVLRGLVLRAAAAVDATDRDRQLAADEARRSEERQQIVMQTVTDAIITIGLDSRIRYANPASGRMFGYTDGELIGTSLTTLMPDRFRDRHLAGIHRYGEDGVRAIDWQGTELVGLRRSGEEFPIDVAFAEAGEGDGRTYTGSIRDISVRKRLETQLLQAQRLESVGRLAGGIAHDFNNVLTAILGFARLTIDELPPGDRQREKVEEIEDAANRASGLVRQLLAFGRQQVLRPETVDLGEVVRGLNPMLQRLIGADIETTVPPADGGWFVEADRGQLEQVVVNLAINARDAMPRGGRLVIEVSSVELEDEYVASHPDVTPGPHILLAVSDNGTGMDAETQAHIFEPFFTTKDAGRGTGLGLATVYGIVLQSGGHIWVYSEPGHGTTFRIYFPRAIHGADARPAAAPAPITATGKETILVAEDEESLRSLIKVVLERLGYRAIVVPNAATALEVAANEPFDLLVTDVVMPGGSGLQLAESIRERFPGARVLYMSGYSEAALESQGGIGGEDALIEKPFTPAALGIAVRQALDRQA